MKCDLVNWSKLLAFLTDQICRGLLADSMGAPVRGAQTAFGALGMTRNGCSRLGCRGVERDARPQDLSRPRRPVWRFLRKGDESVRTSFLETIQVLRIGAGM